MIMGKKKFLSKIHKGLVVSCQALEDEPINDPDVMAKMAQAAKEAGAKAMRCNSPEDCLAIKKKTGLPVIAIIKSDYPTSEVYITPTIKEVQKLLEVEPEVIALDATKRIRPNQEKLVDLVNYIHGNSHTLVM